MMKKMNKKSIMAIVFAAMFVFASVAGIFLPKQASAVGKRGKIRTIKVTSVKKLTVGKRSRIKVKVAPKKVAAKVTYKSSNKAIATVNRKGVVKAKRPGRVTITVKAKSKNTKTKRIKIRVIPKKTSTKKKIPKKKKKQTTSKNTTKRNDTSSGNNGSNNSGKNDNDGEDVTPSYETALDKKTSADGVLNISYSDMTGRKIAGDWCYYLPTDFTKAKTIILPEGTNQTMKALDLSKHKALKDIELANITPASLDLRKNTKLTSVKVYTGKLKCEKKSRYYYYQPKKKVSCKIRFPKKNNIATLYYFVDNTRLDVRNLTKLEDLHTLKTTRIKAKSSWVRKTFNKKN